MRKTLTDITKYPDQVADAKRALNIGERSDLLYRVKRCRAHPDFEANEVTYKLEVAGQVNMARERLQSGTAGWEALLRRAFTSKLNNLTNYRDHDPFLKWMNSDPEGCRRALHAPWSGDGPPEERLQVFCDRVPASTLGRFGTRLSVGSLLLMAEDVHRLPPVKISPFREAWKLAGLGNGPTGEGPGAVYGEILRFLDDLVRDGRSWPVPLRDRLDAQGAVWWATRPADEKLSLLRDSSRRSRLSRQLAIQPGLHVTRWAGGRTTRRQRFVFLRAQHPNRVEQGGRYHLRQPANAAQSRGRFTARRKPHAA